MLSLCPPTSRPMLITGRFGMKPRSLLLLKGTSPPFTKWRERKNSGSKNQSRSIRLEENDKIHVAEGYSTGYCDLIDFCMRLALVDTLFEKEQPFLILDDPFVNLDADRLEKALELLSVMAANKQIVYFVCHPIRAVETAESTASRDEFLKLAEATKQTINKRQAGTTTKKRITRKSPKDMYRLSGTTANIPFKPAEPDYTITNSIFSMSFISEKAKESLCAI